MSFLAPWLLAALPLALLPVVIHLIHRRRHRTIEWAAMRFLLEASRAARGWQRLRHLAILSARIAALAALIAAIARPLAGGWLGFAAGERADAVLILLDRSASMGERDPATGRSKLELGLERFADALSRRRANHWLLLDPLDETPRALDRPEDLLALPLLPATAAATDWERLFERAIERIRENRFGRTELWVITDAQAADWSPESGRWRAIREELAELRRVRTLILSFPELSAANHSVRVDGARRRDDDSGASLELDIEVSATTEAPPGTRVPVEISLGGARTVTEIELAGARARLEGHRVPIDAPDGAGWGSVAIPGDARPGDDRAWFVWGDEPVRRTIVVAEDAELARIISLAAGAPRSAALSYESRVLAPERVGELPWREVALVVWQAPLPTGELREPLEEFVARGGSILFLPPAEPGEERLFGVGWEGWRPRAEPDPVTIDSWQDRDDLLANTDADEPLPVAALRIRERCGIAGGGRSLARFGDGSAALVRATTDAGAAYFLATPPRPGSSNLAQEGVVLYALLQRALESGIEAERAAQNRDAGSLRAEEGDEFLASAHPDAVSTELAAHGGVLRRGDELIALNRPAAEDSRGVLDREGFAALFGEGEWALVEDSLAATGSLLQETWRILIGAMLALLLLEALLCIIDLPRPEGSRGRA